MFPAPVSCFNRPGMFHGQFAEIIRQLQETLSELQETKNHEMRLTLVRHMRLLLLEAERVLDEARAESA